MPEPAFTQFNFSDPGGIEFEFEPEMAEMDAMDGGGGYLAAEPAPQRGRGARRGNGYGGNGAGERPAGPRSPWAGTPRNATCPCGSGKKFKHCHGRI